MVEDKHFIADVMPRGLADIGVHVVGPAASIEDAVALLDDPPSGGAIFDKI